MFVYIDETVFDLAPGDTRFGAGVLVSETAIDALPIAKALDALAADPDRHVKERCKLDAATLRRRYFHASEDSANAHSHLITQINRHFRGAFYYAVGPADRRGPEWAFRERVMQNLVRALPAREPVHVVFEQRGAFTRRTAQQWVDWMYHGLDWTSDVLPWFPTFYPALHIDIKPKQESGLQFADFMLWAAIQTLGNQNQRKACWYERLRRAFWFTGGLRAGEHDGGFKSEHRRGPNPRHDGMYDLSLKNVHPRNDEAVGLHLVMRDVVERSSTEGLPDHAKHLAPLLVKARRGLGSQGSTESVVAIAQYFLRAFDTVPLYQDHRRVSTGFVQLYKAKILAAVVTNTAFVDDTTLARWIADHHSL